MFSILAVWHTLNARNGLQVGKRNYVYIFFISNFRRVLNVLCFLLGNSPASEFRHRGITQ